MISNYFIPCNNSRTSNTICEACQQGKYVKLPLPTSHSVTYFPFQIMHCDLWTSQLESFSGHKYYLVMIDDFSHYMWTFPLWNKSDVFAIVRDFYLLILNQFHMSIQCIQSDNGKEFDNSILRAFLTSRGVALRLSCPYTYPQNGKAECSIRTINDVLHTLLFFKLTCHQNIGPKP